jgi:hypothetical protein
MGRKDQKAIAKRLARRRRVDHARATTNAAPALLEVPPEVRIIRDETKRTAHAAEDATDGHAHPQNFA